MYKFFIRPIFFLLDPEMIHRIVFRGLKLMMHLPGIRKRFKKSYGFQYPSLEREVMGIKFSNPIGLAAGFDKNGELVDELACFGFGFIEVGTATPMAQPGNPKPRLFRLPKDKALINRMGFNNDGAREISHRLLTRKTRIIIGGNIGKNKITPNSNALNDYTKCFNELYPVVDYFVVNVSSPNTPNLRELQEKGPLKELLHALMTLNQKQAVAKPLLLKIAPDLTDTQLDDIIEIATEVGLSGLIATNTTISREGLKTQNATIHQTGGLSGRPVKERSTEVIRYIRERVGDKLAIIGVGGIFSPQDAIDKLAAGADLVQVYTGWIYEGPGMVSKINKAVISQGKA